MKEIKELRKSNKKVFVDDNGNQKARVYSAPVHYKSENEDEWLDVNINVQQENNWETEYCIKENTFKAYFNDLSDVENLTLASFDVDGNWINYKMLDANPDGFEILENGIRYTNVLPNIDLEYIVTTRKLKENIIIKNKTSLLSSFSFSLKKDESLCFSQMNDGSLRVLDENYNSLFRIEKAYMYDANGEISHDIQCFIDKVEYNGVFYDKITLVADETWLNDESRVFPICIDPTTTLDYNDIDVQDTYIKEGNPNNNFGSSDIIRVEDDSNDDNGLIQYETNKTNHTINTVEWNVYESGGFEILSVIRLYYKLLSSWDESTVTWNTKPSRTSDYITDTFTALDWTAVDMTSIFTDWFDGTETNNGFELQMSSSNETMQFVSKESTSTSLIHYLEIDYTNVDVTSTILNISTNPALPTRYYNEFTSITFDYDSANIPNLDKYRVEIYDLDDNLIYTSGQIDVDVAPDTNVTHVLTTPITTIDNYKIRVQSITDDGITGETSVYTSYSYFEVTDTPAFKYNKFTLYGGTSTFDKVRFMDREFTNAELNALDFTDEYTWDVNTRFYAEFEDNTDGGNIHGITSPIINWKLTRTAVGESLATTIAILDDLVQEYYDYTALNTKNYIYRLFAITANEVAAPAESEYIEPDYYGWFLIDPETNTSYKFDVNLSSGTLNNDTDFTRYQTYIRTDAYSRGERDMISGQLTALFHDFSTNECGEIIQTNEDLATFKAFVNSSVDKYLKDRRGRIWKVQTNGVPETQWNDNLGEQIITVTFSYYESGDIFE